MSLILIKNNLKLMLRNKWILLMMTIMPVMVIGMLSNAFHDMLKTGESVMDPFTVGYCYAEGLEKMEGFDSLKEAFASADVTLKGYPQEEMKDLLKDEKIAAFVVFGENAYSLYKTSEDGGQAMIAESVLAGYFSQTGKIKNAIAYEMEHENDMSVVDKLMQTDQETGIKIQTLKTTPIANSVDYYGIIEVVYFAWCGMVSLAAVITSERKHNIDQRMLVSPSNRIAQYLGKLIPCALATGIELAITVLLSMILFDVHWGNVAGSIGIMTLLTFTVSAFGILLFYLFRSTALTIVAGWICIFTMGFLGGSFQSYMYSTIPDRIAVLSPLYHVNRTLVEFSTMGKSDSAPFCAILLLAMFLVFVAAGFPVMNKNSKRK